MRRWLLPLALTVGVGWSCLALCLDQLGLREPETESWDLALVAGCRVMPGGVPSDCLAARTDAAVALYEAGRVEGIVFTGGVGTYPPSEAEVAAIRAREAGVPEAVIWTESRSTSTEENARLAAELVVAAEVVVITDAYHTHRARRVFDRYFDDVDAIGVRSPYVVRIRGAHREVAAVAWYAVNGRL